MRTNASGAEIHAFLSDPGEHRFSKLPYGQKTSLCMNLVICVLVALCLVLDVEAQASDKRGKHGKRTHGIVLAGSGNSSYTGAPAAVIYAEKIAAQNVPVTIFIDNGHSHLCSDVASNINCVVVPDSEFNTRLRNGTRTIMGFREGKIFACMNSPYDFTAFLDIDTRMCIHPREILRSASSLMATYEIGAVFPHSPTTMNTGVMFWRRNTKTSRLFQLWMAAYRHNLDLNSQQECNVDPSSWKSHVESCTNHSEVLIVQDQGAMKEVLQEKEMASLRIFRFDHVWNCKKEITRTNHTTHRCCSLMSTARPTTCIIDHKCF